MANAARVHILEKGLDPRFFSMMAFGGAGPVHAYQVARLLGAPRLIIPAAAGVLSALGFLVSPLAREEVNSFITRFKPNDWNRINEMLLQMTEKCTSFITNAQNSKAEISILRTADMRYKGQGHEIVVPIPQGTLGPESLSAIQEHFCTEYQRRYGRNIPDVQIEAVTWRVLAQSSSPNIVPGQKKAATKRKALKGKRKVFLDQDFYEVPVYDRYALPVGKVFTGPGIIEEFESTTVIGSLARFQVDQNRNIIIEMQEV
jgi:N-methylhydantoinase A